MFFEILSLFLCFFGIFFPIPTNGDVVAIKSVNSTETFQDEEAEFGTSIGKDGLMGFLSLANPVDACSPIIQRSFNSSTYGNITLNAFVLITRGNCDFATKVLNAQEAKFDAVIVHNVGSNELIRMGSTYSDKVNLIVIPSVFVGASDGALLKTDYLHANGVFPYIKLTSGGSPFPMAYYIYPFCIVLGVCFLVMLGFFSIRCIRDRRRQRRSRLSKQRLKQLPVKKFVPGDEYDACAICLEDYEDGEKLRILPCKHAFHCGCVDPWLTSNKRVCPLCKSNVLSDDDASDEYTDDNDDADTNEATPLLRNASAVSPNAPRFATGLAFRNPFARNYSTSPSETAAGPSRVSDNPPHSGDQVSNSEEADVTSPLRRGSPTASSNPLIVLADVSPSTPGLSSSMFSCQSSEDFSCRSNDESRLTVSVSLPGQPDDISTNSCSFDDAPSL